MVVALPQAIKQRLGEGKAQTFVSVLFQIHLMDLTGSIQHLEMKLLLHAEVAVINQISRTDAVDAEQLIAGFKTELFADGPG